MHRESGFCTRSFCFCKARPLPRNKFPLVKIDGLANVSMPIGLMAWSKILTFGSPFDWDMQIKKISQSQKKRRRRVS